MDLRSSESARELARRATELGDGHVDILVDNAAIFPMGPTPSMAEDDIDAAFAVNVKVPFVLVGELAPAMARRGKGAIVNVGTMAAEFGMPGTSLYGPVRPHSSCSPRRGRAEFGPSGVRVNAVNPGPTRTEGTAGLRRSTSSRLWPRPGGQAHRTRSPRRSPIWLPTTPASFTARSSLSTAAAQRPDEYWDRCQRPNGVRRRDRQAAARKSRYDCRTRSDEAPLGP